MRTAITLQRLHGETTSQVIAGPEVPIHEQLAAFKKLAAEKTNAEIAQVEIWTSDSGRIKHRRFDLPKPVETPAKPEEENLPPTPEGSADEEPATPETDESEAAADPSPRKSAKPKKSTR